MAVLANAVPENWQPGDYLEIEDEEFDAASEPGGLIAIVADSPDGYLSLAAAERLYRFLGVAIENSKWTPPDDDVDDQATDGPSDDDIAF